MFSLVRFFLFIQPEITGLLHTQYTDIQLRLNAIIETATDGIITIDEQGIMELINPAAAKLFGYNYEEMAGRNINMLMPEPDASHHDQYVHNYLRTGVRKIIGIGREVRGKRKDGSIFPLRLSISEVLLHDRRIFTGIVHDLTEQKRAEAHIIKLNSELEERVEERTEELASAVNQLLDTNKQLKREVQERQAAENALRESEQEIRNALEREKELSELKSRFVSMASHEFRTPLSTISSSADLIEAYKKDEQQEKRERHTNRIKSAVVNLTNILNDFLSLSRLEEGKIEVNSVLFNLEDFCNETLDEITVLLKPGQTINRHKHTEQTSIYLDAKLLKNILFNLLSNAIKYSDIDKPIDCFIKVEGSTLKIRVTDQGIGIPEEEQQHLFSPFFRAHNVENIQGTGLGLNIVKRYVDLMNGEISFESKTGKGTTFNVVIPLLETHPEK